MTYRTDPWMALCADRACIACGKNDGTVVAAHRNELKGMSLKSPSHFCIPLCHSCHHRYDNGTTSRDEKRAFWRDCWVMHMAALCEAGLVVPVGHNPRDPKYKPLPKILPRAA